MSIIHSLARPSAPVVHSAELVKCGCEKHCIIILAAPRYVQPSSASRYKSFLILTSSIIDHVTSQCNKGQAQAQNFFSSISINLVPKVV